MTSCPSCAAPLDAAGMCAACGALARSSFRGLDLGPPQLAAAVARGLDFYRLLGVEPDADSRQLARRYRQLRVLFPDDPSGLAAEPARKLALLEVAGSALTNPALRQVYDALRAERTTMLQTAVRSCLGCGAPLDADPRNCSYCGTPVPSASSPPSAPPTDLPPAAEPVDYYALIGLTPTHLVALPAASQLSSALHGTGSLGARRVGEHAFGGFSDSPPGADDVDAAAFAREREALLAPGPAGSGRETRAAEIDMARRILRDERRRARYDVLWRAFERGTVTAGHLESLRALQDEIHAEEAGRDEPQQSDGAALLRQGQGLLAAGLPREALAPLRGAVAAQPRDAAAHAAYVDAIFASGHALDLSAHLLQQALVSLQATEELGVPHPNAKAVTALCQGLLARDAGESDAAAAALQQAVQFDSELGGAWCAIAALALGRGSYADALAACRRALAADRRDERALLMATAACVRARRHGEAHAAAAQIAALRGAGWTAEAVLQEID